MAAWTELNPNNLLQGEPLVEEETLAFWENPIAQAEGAPGAPRNAARATAFSTYLEHKTASGNASELTEWTGLDPLAIAQVVTSWFASNNDSGGNIGVTTRIRGSADGGVTWGAWQILDGNSVTEENDGFAKYDIVVNLLTGEVGVSGGGFQGTRGVGTNTTASLGVTSVNALEVNNLSSGVQNNDTFTQSAHGFLHCRAEDT